jgi:transposase
VRPVTVPFADPRRSSTKAFERSVLEWSPSMTLRDVARHLNIGWDRVQEIPKRDRSRRCAQPKLKHLRAIAIDEIAVAKGHRYRTVVRDRERGAVVFVGDGKGAEALQPFGRRLRPSGAKIPAVAMDMSGADQAAVRVPWPQAKIVFDHFPGIQRVNEKRSELRRAWYRAATAVPPKEVLKGTRWRLLTTPANLAAKKAEKQRLKEALALKEPRATAYSLNEDRRRFWEPPGQRLATPFRDGGIRRASASGIKVRQPMAQTLAAHRSGLRADDDVMITSGPREGTNNKIKTRKRPA